MIRTPLFRVFFLLLPVTLLLPANIRTSEAATLNAHSTVTDAEIHMLEKQHEQAEEHILKNDFKGAIRIYNDIILEEPDDETAYTGLGQCYLVLGEYDHAKIAYMNALHIDPDNQTAQAGLKKIKDPDSIDYIEERTVHTQAPAGDAATPTAPAPVPAAVTAPPAEPKTDTDLTVLPAPIPATIPVRYPQTSPAPEISAAPQTHEDDIHLGAKKTMAQYSLDLPKPLVSLSHEQLIQVALKNAGFYRGPVDGVIGYATKRAIKAFQKKFDIVPDGKVGPKTWELLQPFINKNDFEEKILKNGTSL